MNAKTEMDFIEETGKAESRLAKEERSQYTNHIEPSALLKSIEVVRSIWHWLKAETRICGCNRPPRRLESRMSSQEPPSSNLDSSLWRDKPVRSRRAKKLSVSRIRNQSLSQSAVHLKGSLNESEGAVAEECVGVERRRDRTGLERGRRADLRCRMMRFAWILTR